MDPPPRGASNEVAWMETTAGLTASAKSAKLGSCGGEARDADTGPDLRSELLAAVGVKLAPLARTIPKTTAPIRRTRVRK